MSHESCTLVEMIDKLFKSINWDCLLYMRVYIRYWWIFQSYIIQMCVCLYIHKKKKILKAVQELTITYTTSRTLNQNCVSLIRLPGDGTLIPSGVSINITAKHEWLSIEKWKQTEMYLQSMSLKNMSKEKLYHHKHFYDCRNITTIKQYKAI